MKVKDILTEINKVGRLQDKLNNNKEDFLPMDWKDIGSILVEYRFLLENMEVKDDEN